MQKKGITIGGYGMPGCGKTSVTKALGKLLGADTFQEPEEEYWPWAVTERHISGQFSSIMWFRAMRAAILYKAKHIAEQGGIGIIDSYYDKLFIHLMDEPGFEWLIKKDEPYYDIVKQIAIRDYELLPDLDYLIYFELDKKIWLRNLQNRNRATLDREASFLETFDTQPLYRKAAETYCAASNCQLIIQKQAYGVNSPEETAKELILKMNL